MAFEVFARLGTPGISPTTVTLEKTLSSFNMCVLEDREGDPDEVSAVRVEGLIDIEHTMTSSQIGV
jgi:hypothetical protein